MKKKLLSLAVFFTASISSVKAFAIHIYASYECTSANLQLVYDGPGSISAVGGDSPLYLVLKHNPVKPAFLAREESGGNSQLGEEAGEEPLQVIFQTSFFKERSPKTSDLHAGDKCEPDEFDFQHLEWTSKRVITVDQISTLAGLVTGLRSGAKVKFSCRETTDFPIRCPKSGAYQKEDLL